MCYGAFNEVEGVSVVLAELVAVAHAVCDCSDVVVERQFKSSLEELLITHSGFCCTKILFGSHLDVLLSSGLTRDDVPSSRALSP